MEAAFGVLLQAALDDAAEMTRQRAIEQSAIEVHGITNEFLTDKPEFEQVVAEFLDFVDGAELVIHNAPFDIGFLNYELSQLGKQFGRMESRCPVIDTLRLARNKHPGQRNNLDTLCQRYRVDNSQRDLHGALLDAEILADVYLAMTGGQTTFHLGSRDAESGGVTSTTGIRRLAADRPSLPVIAASNEELESHQRNLDSIARASNGRVIWRQLESE